MNAKALAFITGSLCLALLAPARTARAADQEAIIKQITALDDAATASYSDGDFDKMKKQLLKAVALGKGSLASHPIMARVYLHIGVLYVDGMDKRDQGVKYFTKALKIRPDIEVRSNMATKTVMSAFNEAGQEASASVSADEEREALAPRESTKAARKEPVVEKDDEPAAEPERRPSARAGGSDKCSDSSDVKRQARDEFDRLEKALSVSKDALTKERAESAKYRQDNMDLERALTEAKARVAQLEKDTAAKEKTVGATAERENKERAAREALQKEKVEKETLLQGTAQRIHQLELDIADRDKKIAAGEQRERQAREANEKLEREKRDALDKLAQEKREAAEKLANAKRENERVLADYKTKSSQSENDLKSRLAQIERDKAEKEKLLASTSDRERKERETREKLEHDRQEAAARERERAAWADRARAERDKLEALPPLPARVPEPVYCALPDEVQGGADFFVNCVTQPQVKAKTLVFYYRPANATIYNSVVMDPTKKGWSRAVITANKLNGKLLQYYAEARDSHDTVTASNGKASSPNIVPITAPGKK